FCVVSALSTVCSESSSLFFSFYCYDDHPDLHSFPTRRSSDLRSDEVEQPLHRGSGGSRAIASSRRRHTLANASAKRSPCCRRTRSEEHTSELQSRFDLVCRLLLEKKNKHNRYTRNSR